MLAKVTTIRTISIYPDDSARLRVRDLVAFVEALVEAGVRADAVVMESMNATDRWGMYVQEDVNG